MIDIDRYNVLTSLVKEARIEDSKAFDEMERTKLLWKKANETLTDRNKVLKEFIDATISEATAK